jgi:N-dimethylarginine dimethylaminohydrolase
MIHLNCYIMKSALDLTLKLRTTANRHLSIGEMRNKMNDRDPNLEIDAYMNLHRQIPGEPEPAFEEPAMLEKVWGRRWGVNNDVGRIRSVLVSRPGDEWQVMMQGGEFDEGAQAWIGPDKMWYWSDQERPDLHKAQTQHGGLVSALEEEGVEVVHLEQPLANMTKSVFTRDPAIIVNGGAIICRMGVSYRRGEELPFTRTLAKLGMPILHTVHGSGLMEGGSFVWLNPETAVVSIGHRCNTEGARQIGEVLKTLGVELLRVDNMGYGLHIDGSFVMVTDDLALAFIQDLPWWFLDRLKDLGIHILDADPRDGAFGVNCLSVRPGRVLMSAHAERSAALLEKAGIEVVLVEYDELHKGGGGIHCSTLPLTRDEV